MSTFVFKLIAIISMFTDHISYVIFDNFSFLNYIGRLAFPIFAFQISQGYQYTNNYKKYFLKLFVFAIVSQIPFILFTSVFSNSFSLNIFFTLLLGLIGIIIYDKLKNKYHYLGIYLGIFITILLGFLANLIKTDYGFYGVFIIVAFYIFKDNKLNNLLVFIITTMIYYLQLILKNGYDYRYIILLIFTIIPFLLITLFYNNKKGPDTKYFLYLFYPLHLLIFYFFNLLLQ